jgi:benzoyl-CoA reductase/2-hydroxyglutaryl-CoA dehydratase subunit BcrC/BadD/HgdB
MTTESNPKTKLDTLVRSCRMIQKLNRSRMQTKPSENLYIQCLIDYFSNIVSARSQSKPLVMHTIFMPAEILYAMDLVPMHAEVTSWMVPSFTGSVASHIAKAAEIKLAPEICSAHRVLAGAMTCGDLPRPDAIVWSNLCCDNSAKSGELLQKITGSPGFFMDAPFSESPAEIAYLANEMEGLISFLEKVTGHKMDWAKLNVIIQQLNRQIELYREIFELRKAEPSPFPVQRFGELMISAYLLPGQPQTITYLETLRNELAEMVARGEGAVQPERLRLMSLFIPPPFMMGMLGEISRESGAISVVEPLLGLWSEQKLDPDKPLESLARKSFLMPEIATYGPLNERILAATERCAREFKIDGALFYAHVGCRQGAGLIKAYRDILSRMDIPLFVLDMDLLDETVTSPDEVKSKFLQFMEILEDR